MKAAEWIDRVKAVKGIESDYGAAKALGLSRQTISGYRSKIPTLDEDTAVKVAKALGINPAGIVLDQAAERVKDAAVRSALQREVDRLCIMSSRPRPQRPSTAAEVKAALRRRVVRLSASH